MKRGTVRVKKGPRIQVNIYMSAQRGGKKSQYNQNINHGALC